MKQGLVEVVLPDDRECLEQIFTTFKDLNKEDLSTYYEEKLIDTIGMEFFCVTAADYRNIVLVLNPEEEWHSQYNRFVYKYEHLSVLTNKNSIKDSTKKLMKRFRTSEVYHPGEFYKKLKERTIKMSQKWS